MGRITKIPCDGAIYTVRTDPYGSVTEMDTNAGADEPPESDDTLSGQRARYAQMLQELTEFEEAIARAEERNFLGDHSEEFDVERDEESDLF